MVPLLFGILIISCAIKIPLIWQAGVLGGMWAVWLYKCFYAEDWIELKPAIYGGFICYIAFFLAIGDIIYYIAYYDNVNNLSISDALLWIFKP